MNGTLARLAALLDGALWPAAAVGLCLLLGVVPADGGPTVADGVVALVFLAHFVVRLLLAEGRTAYLSDHPLDVLLCLPVVLSLYEPAAASAAVVVRQTVVAARALVAGPRVGTIVTRVHLNPRQWLALSFLATIGVGTILLMLPVASSGDGSLALVDALFTATSAVCVTGLAVKDTAFDCSSFGEGVLLALIQIGGLGIMTISTSFILASGRRLAVSHRAELRDLLDEDSAEQARRLVVAIVEFTLFCEVVGALLLALHWTERCGGFTRALWYGVFHAVSAFCNAGFALFSDSLVAFVGDPVVNAVMMALIVGGGMGFAVVLTLRDRWRRRRSRYHRPLPLSVRLALVVTAVLLAVGTLFCFFAEYDGALAGRPLGEKFLAALFQSVTTRTAGFNTVDLNHLGPPTVAVFLLLMFIGASPGSTGGGVKTTTFGVLALTMRAGVTGRRNVTVFGRRIGDAQIARAFALLGLVAATVFVCTVLLLLTDRAPLTETLFEVVSATATVGLTLGLTPKLSVAGKLPLCFLMFVGRVGPLTLAMALAENPDRDLVTYPEERVVLG